MVSGNGKHGIEQPLRGCSNSSVVGPCGGFCALRFVKWAVSQGQLLLMACIAGPSLRQPEVATCIRVITASMAVAWVPCSQQGPSGRELDELCNDGVPGNN